MGHRDIRRQFAIYALWVGLLVPIALVPVMALSAKNKPEVETSTKIKSLVERANAGDEAAQLKLGIMYALGLHVAENKVEAVKWYRKAAEQGDAYAQYNLGIMYAQGHGVPKDDAEAVKWYRKAAEQGFCGAQFSVGAAFAEGRGVAQNDVEAYKWFLLAEAKSEGAKAAIAALERFMTPEQRTNGQQEAHDWWATHNHPAP